MSDQLKIILNVLNDDEVRRYGQILETTCRFLDKSKIGKPKVRWSFHDTNVGYVIIPVYKIKLTSQDRKVCRTVTKNCDIFKFVSHSFSLPEYICNDIVNKALALHEMTPYGEMNDAIEGAFINYKSRPEHKEELEFEKNLAMDRLKNRMEREVMEKFRVLHALGKNSDYISNLYNRVEVESVLGS